MTLLQFFFIISGVIILILAIDIAKKQRFNALHFLVFIGVGGGLLSFTFFPDILNSIGSLFGVARGADVLVYTSIIFLLYFVLLLLTKHVDNKENITSLVRNIAIENSIKKIIEGKEVILIRAFNESTIISKVLDKILDKGYKNILVINDGSTDNTLEILKKYSDKIFYINHYQNCGAGAALETGFEYIRRYGKIKYIFTFDADDQHDINDLDKFINEFDKNNKLDVILGSRFIENNTNIPFFRKITLFIGKIFTLFISGIYLTDAHNGFRGFTLEAVNSIKLKIDSMAYASEIIELIKLKKLSYKEVPVTIKYTDYSLSKGQSSGNAINIALRIIWSKFFK